MKIYLRPKSGRPVPADARFSISSFSHDFHIPIAERCDLLPPPSPPIPVLQRIDSPTREEWIASVEATLQEIASGRLQKAVLARKTTLLLPFAPNPFAVASALASRCEGAALYCVALDEGRAFLGASPERLYERQGCCIESEAVAGTRKIGESFEPLAKDLAEFQFVEEHLNQKLSPLCISPVEFTPHHLIQTNTVQHLSSHCFGTLRRADDEKILAALHPTPALCGTPQNAARKWISEIEPFQRGFYGGYVGWQTEDSSEWTVCIRCCSLEKTVAELYTGAGIVAGSDPFAEWEELEAKLSLYHGIFAWNP